jgi:hypothetical protein
VEHRLVHLANRNQTTTPLHTCMERPQDLQQQPTWQLQKAEHGTGTEH